MFEFLRSRPSQSLFEELVYRYQEPVYCFVRRRTGSADDAADITQEVFIRVYRNLNSLKDKDSARAWIFRIAANEMARFMSRKSPEMVAPDEILVEPAAPEADSLSTEEINRKFRRALELLSDRQRNVFEMRYFSELSYEEIAEAMGSNVATMKSTYHIAKQKITSFITETD